MSTASRLGRCLYYTKPIAFCNDAMCQSFAAARCDLIEAHSIYTHTRCWAAILPVGRWPRPPGMRLGPLPPKYLHPSSEITIYTWIWKPKATQFSGSSIHCVERSYFAQGVVAIAVHHLTTIAAQTHHGARIAEQQPTCQYQSS